MALIDVATGKEIRQVPLQEEFDAVQAKLSVIEFWRIIAALNAMIDTSLAESGRDIVPAAWLTGHEWAGSVFEPIDAKGTGGDHELAGRFFGQAVWFAIMGRSERWASSRDVTCRGGVEAHRFFRIH